MLMINKHISIIQKKPVPTENTGFTGQVLQVLQVLQVFTGFTGFTGQTGFTGLVACLITPLFVRTLSLTRKYKKNTYFKNILFEFYGF